VIDRKIGDRRGEGKAFGNLGIAYKDLGEPRRAIEYYEQALVIDREIGDRQGEAISCWNLGVLLVQQGELPRAVELMQVSADYYRSIDHPDAEKMATDVQSLRLFQKSVIVRSILRFLAWVGRLRAKIVYRK